MRDFIELDCVYRKRFLSCLSYYRFLEEVSRLNDGGVAIRGGRIHLYLEAGSVVPVDVASDDPANGEQVMKGKPVSTIPKIIKNT
ncbi:MAG: hypothetical protein QXE32_04970 [Sulfolobales archaeon]